MEILRKIASVGPKREDLSWMLVVSIMFASLGYFQYGYNIWVVQLVFEQTSVAHNITEPNLNKEPSLLSLFLDRLPSYIFPIGSIFGTLFSGLLMDRCGRKVALVISNLMSLISAFFLACAGMFDNYEFILFSILFSGICTGTFSCTVPIYIGEIASVNVRGGMCILPSVFLSVGGLTAQALTRLKKLANRKGILTLMILPAILSFVTFLALPFFPESPRYLLIQKGNEEKAMEALKNLRGTEDVEDEIDEMHQEDNAEKTEKAMTVAKLLCYRRLRWHVISLLILIGGQQFSGISVIFYHSEKIFLKSGVPKKYILYILLSTILFIISSLILLAYIIDSVGRRKVLLLGFSIISFFSVVLTMSLELQTTVPWMSYISTISTLVFLIGHTIGPAPVPNVMIVELFLQSSRASAAVIAKTAFWVASVITAVMYLLLELSLLISIQESMEILRKIASVGPRREDLTGKFVFISMISSLGYLQYGYNFWVAKFIFASMDRIPNSTEEHQPASHSPRLLTFLDSLAIFIFPVGGIIGCLCTGPLLDTCGRKATLIFNNFVSIIAAVIMGYSSIIYIYEFTLFSSFFSGVCSGLGSCAIPVYLGEISPDKVRGAVIMMLPLFFAFGTSLAQLLTSIKSLGSHEGMGILMIISGSMSLIGFIVLPFFPESPRFLLIQKGSEEKATEALKKLRGTADVEEEIEDMNQEDIDEKEEKDMNVLKLMCFQKLRWNIISLVVLIVGQQFSGISVVYFYSENIFLKAGVKRHILPYMLCMASSFVFLVILLSTYIIDSVGRKKLLLIGFGINSFFCILLTMSLELQDSAPWMSYISIFGVFVFLIGQHIGPGPIPNVLMVEMFLQSSRTSACVLGKIVQWFCSLAKAVLFLFIESFLGTYIFLIFWPICTATLIYVFKMIPETTQMAFIDIRRAMVTHVGKTIKGSSGGLFRRHLTRGSIKGHPRRKSTKQ
ncbi:solute carrier family 2, facilitated glucose transporter member 7-like isoform X2 [Hemicordylus capensis]|uniref:solute carrier family 2, facilitated glucose transporter member 7-like isoform X2 n=1 Tax=Hemicordylus capensis TaxID=884348 RepID=UPI0023029AFB|nr:solute carrier family 2, facilitated glucose transporter member 7-like isoform X2 [Hemicordylus capensis]